MLFTITINNHISRHEQTYWNQNSKGKLLMLLFGSPAILIFQDHRLPRNFKGLAQLVKNLPAMQKTWVRSLGWENSLEKGMATHSNILAWRIPWTEEPNRLQSMGLQKVEHSWVAIFTFTFPGLLGSDMFFSPREVDGDQHAQPQPGLSL